MSNTAEQNKTAALLKEARAWTPDGISQHAVAAQDTITRLASALENAVMHEGITETQYRVTVRFGTNVLTWSGYNVESIIAKAERESDGPVTVLKVETRTVTTKPWSEQ